MTSYKDTVSLPERISESQRVLSKYPDRVPVVIDSLDNFACLKKKKFLVPIELNVSQLLSIIHKQLIKTSKSGALFIFCDNQILQPSLTINEVYESYKEKPLMDYGKGDRFLYLQIAYENTFGNKH